MNLQKPPKPIRDRKHVAWLHEFGCIICGWWPVEAAHIRYGDIETGKPHTPMNRKPGDNWVLPLCAKHHRTGPDAQHRGNERDWWERQGIDPLPIAKALYAVSGDIEQAGAILRGLQQEKTL